MREKSDLDEIDPSPKAERLVSLDAFRGAIMLLMASAGLGLAQVAEHHPDSPFWRWLGYHCAHVPWVGCSLWDLIQPAFMFMVGVALPYSIANRQARGQTFRVMGLHALWRGLFLVLLAVFLSSAWSRQTNWVFTNVLAQIGLGYPFLFLVAFTSTRAAWGIAGGLLLVYWLAFALHPTPSANFDWAAVGVPADWPHLSGFAAHWEKNANFAATVDLWVLNQFPRAEAFTHSAGGYQTLNFVPSLATMIFGLIAGRLLRSELVLSEKIKRLVITGVAGLVIGQIIAWSGLCPIVKRVWTPSWAIFSGGWVALMLAIFVWVIEVRGWKRWAFPLVVVGLNPITLYCLWQLSGGFFRHQIRIHLGQEVFASFGDAWVPALERGSVLLVLWLIVWWMYRRKIFLRI